MESSIVEHAGISAGHRLPDGSWQDDRRRATAVDQGYFGEYLDQRFKSIEDKVAVIERNSERLRDDFTRSITDIKNSISEQQAETRNLVNLVSSETRSEVQSLRARLDSTHWAIVTLAVTAVASLLGIGITAVSAIRALLKAP